MRRIVAAIFRFWEIYCLLREERILNFQLKVNAAYQGYEL